MTTTVTNRATLRIPQGDLVLSTLYMGLLFDLPPGAHDKDFNFVSDLLAYSGVNEVSGGGYARQQITTITPTENDTDDRTDVSADTVDFGSITAGTGTAYGMFVYKTGANDAARELFIIADMPPQAFNGGQVTVPLPTLLRIAQKAG